MDAKQQASAVPTTTNGTHAKKAEAKPPRGKSAVARVYGFPNDIAEGLSFAWRVGKAAPAFPQHAGIVPLALAQRQAFQTSAAAARSDDEYPCACWFQDDGALVHIYVRSPPYAPHGKLGNVLLDVAKYPVDLEKLDKLVIDQVADGGETSPAIQTKVLGAEANARYGAVLASPALASQPRGAIIINLESTNIEALNLSSKVNAAALAPCIVNTRVLMWQRVKEEVQGQLKDSIVWRLGRIFLFPDETELFSRAKGLIERNILQQKTVAIIGIGSGASPIAQELTRAGVGHLVLIDFDTVELSNVSRHICDIRDVGRMKIDAVAEKLKATNPFVQITTRPYNFVQHYDLCLDLLRNCDLLVCGTDNHKSRFKVNQAAKYLGKPAIFGRAYTRACAGEVIRVRGHDDTAACLQCMITDGFAQKQMTEITSVAQALDELPEYAKGQENLDRVVQVGLNSDITPISNMMIKIALMELSRGQQSGIQSLEDDLVADFYLWGNRRESPSPFDNRTTAPMGWSSNARSILRWIPVRFPKRHNCEICGISDQTTDDTTSAASNIVSSGGLGGPEPPAELLNPSN